MVTRAMTEKALAALGIGHLAEHVRVGASDGDIFRVVDDHHTRKVVVSSAAWEAGIVRISPAVWAGDVNEARVRAGSEDAVAWHALVPPARVDGDIASDDVVLLEADRVVADMRHGTGSGASFHVAALAGKGFGPGLVVAWADGPIGPSAALRGREEGERDSVPAAADAWIEATREYGACGVAASPLDIAGPGRPFLRAAAGLVVPPGRRCTVAGKACAGGIREPVGEQVPRVEASLTGRQAFLSWVAKGGVQCAPFRTPETGSPVRVFTDCPQVAAALSSAPTPGAFALVQDEGDAHVRWFGRLIMDFSTASRVNQFPFQSCVVAKNLLAHHVRRLFCAGGRWPPWFAETFVLPLELPAFLSRGEGGFFPEPWMLKPWALSRSRGVVVTQSPACAFTSLTGTPGAAMVATRYIQRPVTVGGHKFDTRWYLAVRRLTPVEAFVSTTFYARVASRKYTAPETGEPQPWSDARAHLTVTKYRTDTPGTEPGDEDGCRPVIHGPELLRIMYAEALAECRGLAVPGSQEEGEALTPAAARWGEELRRAVRDQVMGAVVAILEAHVTHPAWREGRCSALFGVDILFERPASTQGRAEVQGGDDGAPPVPQPVLLEVNFSPDLEAATTMTPSFPLDALGLLFGPRSPSPDSGRGSGLGAGGGDKMPHPPSGGSPSPSSPADGSWQVVQPLVPRCS